MTQRRIIQSRFPSWKNNKTVADPLGLAVSFLTCCIINCNRLTKFDVNW